MERPLAHHSFTMLWKILFLIMMELGIRNGLVNQSDNGALHEEGEEEADPTHDPEVENRIMAMKNLRLS